ncbi:MAG: hypothetical protein CMG75_10535 [Candidatus Marinimicrobia bacterium]|nr:hypothetical protein [Candidatus Neomarinimicrobiota bacterium]|tara:strand:+ start:9084 stop:10286 length:1203 start_codon:yes stop_codon:yes gene_type:complete
MIGFEFWMAIRMLLSRKKVGFISWSGFISIIGVSVGCFALIVSIAVLNGFEQEVRNKIIGFEAEIRLTPLKKELRLKDLIQLDEINGIHSYSPFLDRKALAISPNGRHLVKVKSIIKERLTTVYNIEGLESENPEKSKKAVYLGKGIADRLGIQKGDKFRLINPLDNQLYLGMPSILDGQISGVFETRILDFDQKYVLIPLESGQELFKTENNIDGVDIRLDKNVKRDNVKEALNKNFGENVSISYWENLHQTLFKAMRMEKIGSIVILSLIVIVACFNIASTLTMLMMEKIREIGILRAIGFSQSKISNLFRLQGLFIGVLGLFLGSCSGFLFVVTQNKFGFIRLPETIYFVEKLPVVITFFDISIILLIGMLLVFLSVNFPSMEVKKLVPSKAIKFEK